MIKARDGGGLCQTRSQGPFGGDLPKATKISYAGIRRGCWSAFPAISTGIVEIATGHALHFSFAS